MHRFVLASAVCAAVTYPLHGLAAYIVNLSLPLSQQAPWISALHSGSILLLALSAALGLGQATRHPVVLWWVAPCVVFLVACGVALFW